MASVMGTPMAFSSMAMRVGMGTLRPMAVSASAWENTSSGVPSMTTCPSLRTMSRSAMRAMSSMLWVTSTMVESVASR